MQVVEALGIQPGDVIAVVGGGGKTTLMFKMADELASRGLSVVTTTSTRLAARETLIPPKCLAQSDPQILLAKLHRALLHSRHVLAVNEIVPQLDKAVGLPLTVIEQIAALPEVDVLIVEADGSHELPFKAPAAHEPVIPACATIVIPVAGLDILGQPLTAEHVHRPEQVASLAGVAIGSTINAPIVATVIGHREGGCKSVPPTARVVPFLNKAASFGARRAAYAIAEMLLERPWIERVAIGAVAAADPVWAIRQRSFDTDSTRKGAMSVQVLY